MMIWEWLWGEEGLEEVPKRFDVERFYRSGRYRRAWLRSLGVTALDGSGAVKVEALKTKTARYIGWPAAMFVAVMRSKISNTLSKIHSEKLSKLSLSSRLIKKYKVPTLEVVYLPEGDTYWIDAVWFRAPILPGISELIWTMPSGWYPWRRAMDVCVLDRRHFLGMGKSENYGWGRFAGIADILRKIWAEECATYQLLRGEV